MQSNKNSNYLERRNVAHLLVLMLQHADFRLDATAALHRTESGDGMETEESETEHLPNAITSWRLLKKRKRWYRCLDAGYLSLKVFLLERFLHDILFESSSPQLLRDFCLGTKSTQL